MNATRKASGANIPEADRHTVQVKLRLHPEAAAALRAYAHRECVSVSAAVTALLPK